MNAAGDIPMNAAGGILAPEPEFADEGVIRCICGTTEDDGFTIQCEKCFVWQHAGNYMQVTNAQFSVCGYHSRNCS